MITSTINITKEISDNEGVYDFTLLREAIRDALSTNFYDILKRNGIDTISTLDADTATNIVIAVSSTSNQLFINRVSDGITIATINYNPYISYVKYRQFVSESDEQGFNTVINKYKPVATILMCIIIDSNICGFSLLSPANLQLVDEENNLYSITNTVNDVDGASLENIDVLDFPEVIKLQSKLIYDPNSYYEISYSDINTPYDYSIVPCVNGMVYDNENNSVSFKSLFNDLQCDFEPIDNSNVLGNTMLLPKLLSSAYVLNGVIVNSSILTGYANTIFDCPQLDVTDYWNINNTLNIGDTITIGDSNYIISNKNTLIQLANTEIYAINKTITYDGKPHFFNLVYPLGASAYYKLSNVEGAEWIAYPEDISSVTDFVNAQIYTFDYKVVVSSNGVDKEYYGNAELTIENANQYGYLVESYNSSYDAMPHTLYIYTDADVEYSLDQISWSSTPPSFTDVGTYKVYYRLTKNNYTTVEDYVDLIITSITPEQKEALNFGIDITQNIIVMRSQLYANIKSNLFLEATNNNVYLSTYSPTNINLEKFIGQFPDPTTTTGNYYVLGSFNLSPGMYYLVIESYFPWYYQGVEPTVTNNSIDAMLTSTPFTFTVDYHNGSNYDISLDTTGWSNVVSNAIPSNGFYNYKITNIDIGENPVGNLWDSTGAMSSVKRLLVKLDITTENSGTETKTIRITCNHTGELQYNESTSLPFNPVITNSNIGISVIPLTKFQAPSSISSTNVTYNGEIFAQIPIKFKSELTRDANFIYNCGNNLEYCGGATLNYDDITINNNTYPGVDSTTGIFDSQAFTLWRNGLGNSVTGNMALNWSANTYFSIIKNTPVRLQFNPVVNEHIMNRDNVNSVYSYLNCI